jgi:putative colanic acid biosynthesis acetyltransferase WcaF
MKDIFDFIYRHKQSKFFAAAINIAGNFYLALWNLVFCYIPSYHLRIFIAKYLYGIKTQGTVNIHMGVKFLKPWHISIGKNVNIQLGCFLDGRGGLEIGDDVDITIGVKILSQQHDIQSATYDTQSKKVVLGNRCVIGSYALILPGVTIGEGCVIASGAVVPKSTRPWTMHAGNPAVEKSQRSNAQTYDVNFRRPFH